MSAILVTGAAGFIGSHVAERLLIRGEEVVGVDDVNDFYPVSLKRENIKLLETFPRFRFIEADIADEPAMKEIFRDHKIARVGHLAGRAGVRPSIREPLVYERANVRGTTVLLDLAAKSRVECFVLASSSSVYGNSKQIPFREEDSATDRPISPYAATKKACEVLAYTYHHLHGLPVNVVRPFTVYGPRGRPDMAPWLFVEAAFRGTPIRKFGNGETRRDYTFIDDFAAGFIAALDRPFGYEIFNLGNSTTVSLNAFLDIVREVTGRDLVIEQHPMQPGDVEMTNADITRARTMLGYEPSTPFRTGMERFVEWYRLHRVSGESTV